MALQRRRHKHPRPASAPSVVRLSSPSVSPRPPLTLQTVSQASPLLPLTSDHTGVTLLLTVVTGLNTGPDAIADTKPKSPVRLLAALRRRRLLADTLTPHKGTWLLPLVWLRLIGLRPEPTSPYLSDGRQSASQGVYMASARRLVPLPMRPSASAKSQVAVSLIHRPRLIRLLREGQTATVPPIPMIVTMVTFRQVSS